MRTDNALNPLQVGAECAPTGGLGAKRHDVQTQVFVSPSATLQPRQRSGAECGSVPPARATSGSVGDGQWLSAARWARRLAWASLVWMCVEGGVGLWQGFAAGSISLIGWALGSAVEGLASLIVVWRFSGSRTLSESAERLAQRGVAVSFWLLAPYVFAQSVANLFAAHHPEVTVIGIALTSVALLEMPVLGRTKHDSGSGWARRPPSGRAPRTTSAAPKLPRSFWC